MDSMGAEFMMDDIPLRLEYLAAYVRPLVDVVEIVDLNGEARPLSHFIARWQPDLVGITMNYVSVYRTARQLACQAKASGAAVVVGGYQATASAMDLATSEEVDYVVRGEGEETLGELVQGHPLRSIKGLSWQEQGYVVTNPDRPLVANLDQLPIPERHRRRRSYSSPFMDLESDAGTAYDMIITSRGCRGRCKFCTEPLMSSGTQRYRSPQKVLEEIKEIVRLHRGRKRLKISISDPNFGGNLRLAEELCDLLIEYKKSCPIDLHFFISVKTNTIANHLDLARKMVQAGMDYIFVGMESPNRKDLRNLDKGGGARHQQELAASHLRACGASIMSNFLLGIPGQTADDIWELVEYAKKLELTDAYFSVMTPLPGSALYEQTKRAGKLLNEDFTSYRLWDCVIEHDVLSRAEISELCLRCNAKWYDDLLLRQEIWRWKTNGGKQQKTYVYARKFRMLWSFFAELSRDAQAEFSGLDPSLCVVDLVNPQLRQLSETTGLHQLLDLDRFLRLLGNQKIQVTVNVSPTEQVSWVMKTTSTSVEYIESIQGTTDSPTLSLSLSLTGGTVNWQQLLTSVLRQNRSPKALLALTRLVAAVTGEVGTYCVDEGLDRGRTRLARLQDRLPLRRPSSPGPSHSRGSDAPTLMAQSMTEARPGDTATLELPQKSGHCI
jgi:anaerobic magnesium-protoporphyrin IX monomethyl ester cyclase